MLQSIALPQATVCSFHDSNDRASNSFNLEAAGRAGSGRVNVRVAGYWSSEVITLYIRREINWYQDPDERSPEWKVTMSHSSGGRLTALDDKNHTAERGYVGVESDLIAEANFGHALIAAATFGDELLNYTEALEHWYQVERAERKVEEEAAKAEQQAKINDDLAIGVDGAKAILNASRAAVTRYQPITYTVYERGYDTGRELVCSKGQFITWTYAGQRMSEENVIKTLAAASIRTNHVAPQAA